MYLHWIFQSNLQTGGITLMNETWVKLYRKTNDKRFMKDHLAFILFSWLLINVNKETGSKKIGRFVICEELGINTNTYYKVLRRLKEKWGVIDVKSTNEYTEVWIVNWAKYQHKESAQDNTKTISRQSGDNQETTIQEYKNKEIRNINNTDVLAKPAVVADLDPINKLIALFSEVNPNYKTLYANKTQRGALTRMVNEHGSEKIEWAIKTLVKSNSMLYAPTITTPLELEQKLGSLIAFLQKKKGDMQPKIAVVS